MKQKIENMRDFLNAVIESTEDAEIIAFADDEITKMNLRNEKRKSKITEAQKENAILKDKILEYVQAETQYLASDVAKDFGFSPQKASALLRQLVQEGALRVDNVRIDSKGLIKEDSDTGAIRKAYSLG